MLTITNLNQTYPGGVRALADINLRLGRGMFGLLGPNGAGKSTLMRTIATLQVADTGQLAFDGIDIRKEPMQLRRRLGYLPQEFGVYPGVSAQELLHYFARLKGLSARRERLAAVDRVLDIVNLTQDRRQAVSNYSGGMKRRFGIAQVLLNRPDLVIVDEPTAGLDPAERNRFLDILREVGAESTVIFSTHIVDDVRQLCTDMAILNAGRVVMHDSPAVAARALAGRVWTGDLPATDPAPRFGRILSTRYVDSRTIRYRVASERADLPNFQSATPDLEDVYFLALNK